MRNEKHGGGKDHYNKIVQFWHQTYQFQPLDLPFGRGAWLLYLILAFRSFEMRDFY
jgi:hypothetical protein